MGLKFITLCLAATLLFTDSSPEIGDNIEIETTIENYAQLVAKKNSVIDYLNKNIPLKKINTLNYPISKFYVKSTYYFALCGEHPETVRFFNIEKGKVSMFKGKLEE